jgi:hypothetical protein
MRVRVRSSIRVSVRSSIRDSVRSSIRVSVRSSIRSLRVTNGACIRHTPGIRAEVPNRVFYSPMPKNSQGRRGSMVLSKTR